MVIASFNEILRWITEFNFGADVAPPECEFYKVARADTARMDAIDKAVRMGCKLSKRAVSAEIQVPEAIDEDDVLQPAEIMQNMAFNQHSCPSCHSSHQFVQAKNSAVDVAAQAADDVLENDFIEPIYDMLKHYEERGKTLAEFMQDLPKLFSQLDDTALVDINSQVLMYALAKGVNSQQIKDQYARRYI